MQVGSESGPARATADLAEAQAEYLLRFERLLSEVSSMLVAASPAEVPEQIEESLHAVTLFRLEPWSGTRAGSGTAAAPPPK